MKRMEQKSKKVLWLCNMVLPDFSQEFTIKRNNFGGWMTGMLHGLEQINDLDVSLCFPIMDKNRLRDGKYNGHNYYAFLFDSNAVDYNFKMIETFDKILEKDNPDIIHIWGTEYPHTMAMLLACKQRRLLNRVVINIQGLISVCAKHYLKGIPEEYKILKFEGMKSMKEECDIFEKKGKCELESIKMARHIIGRTDWDKAHVERINPQARYYYCNEILRDKFYEFAGKWDYDKCQKHSIFVSQASYPIKGFHYLLQAMPDIIRRFPDTHVYVAGKNLFDLKGENSYANYLKNIVKDLELSETIFFLDNLDEMQMIQQYLSANVFVLPSIMENSSNSLCEARMIGVPSVASFVGGACNWIDFGKDGYLYPCDEPSLLSYYVNQIFENGNGICAQFSSNSVRKMLVINDSKSCVDRTKDIYEKILESNSDEN